MSDQPPPPQISPPPGWYPDPADGSRHRWWDGNQWTNQIKDPSVPLTVQGMQTPIGNGQLRPVGAWLGDSFRESLASLGHCLPLILLLVVPLAMLSAYLTWEILIDASLVISPDGSLSASGFPDEPVLLIGMGASRILALLASYWLFGAITDQVHRANSGEPVPWSASMREGLRRLPRLLLGFLARLFVLIGSSLFVVAVGAFIAMLVPALGMLVIAFAMPILWIILWVRLSLVGTVAIVDETNPLSGSWRLTSGNFWALLGRFIVLVIVFIGIWFSISVISSIFGATSTESMPAFVPDEPIEFTFSALLPSNPAFYLIGALIGALGAGLRQILLATASLILHRDLSASEHSSTSTPPSPAY